MRYPPKEATRPPPPTKGAVREKCPVVRTGDTLSLVEQPLVRFALAEARGPLQLFDGIHEVVLQWVAPENSARGEPPGRVDGGKQAFDLPPREANLHMGFRGATILGCHDDSFRGGRAGHGGEGYESPILHWKSGFKRWVKPVGN